VDISLQRLKAGGKGKKLSNSQIGYDSVQRRHSRRVHVIKAARHLVPDIMSAEPGGPFALFFARHELGEPTDPDEGIRAFDSRRWILNRAWLGRRVVCSGCRLSQWGFFMVHSTFRVEGPG